MRIPLPAPLLAPPRPKPPLPTRPGRVPFAPLLAEKADKPKGAPPPAPKLATSTPSLVGEPSTPPTPPLPRAPSVERRPAEPDDPLELDPAARMVAQLAPPPSTPVVAAQQSSPGAPSIDPHLAHELVERAAFWGDGTRGLARLRFGGKARAGLSGATVTLEHDGESLRLRVDEADDPELAARLRQRLAARGLNVEE